MNKTSTPVTSKTHPAGTRYLTYKGFNSLTAIGVVHAGLSEIVVVEWSKEGNVKASIDGAIPCWLSAGNIPESVEILVKGKNEEAEIEEFQKHFSDLFSGLKDVGKGTIDNLHTAFDKFLKGISKDG